MAKPKTMLMRETLVIVFCSPRQSLSNGLFTGPGRPPIQNPGNKMTQCCFYSASQYVIMAALQWHIDLVCKIDLLIFSNTERRVVR